MYEEEGIRQRNPRTCDYTMSSSDSRTAIEYSDIDPMPPPPLQKIPSWLQRMAGQPRRGSVGFSDTGCTPPSYVQDDPVEGGGAVGGLLAPLNRFRFKIGGWKEDNNGGGSPDNVLSPSSSSERSLAAFLAEHNNSHKSNQNPQPQTVETVHEVGVIGEKLVEAIGGADRPTEFPVATHESLVAIDEEINKTGGKNNDSSDVFEMDLEDAEDSRKMGRIANAIKESKLTQNWFFQGPNLGQELTGNEGSNRVLNREMNMWSPQTL